MFLKLLPKGLFLLLVSSLPVRAISELTIFPEYSFPDIENPLPAVSKPSGTLADFQIINKHPSGKTTICADDKIVLAAPNTYPGAKDYRWKRNGFTIINGPNETEYTISGSGSGVYTLEITDANNNVRFSDPVNVTVNQLTVIQFDPIPAFCGGSVNKRDLIILCNVQPATGGTFSGVGMSGSIFDPAISGNGTFPVTYTYTAPNGCVSTKTQDAHVSSYPRVLLGNNLNIFRGDTVQLKSITPPGMIYEWTYDRASPISNKNAAEPFVAPVENTVFKLKVTNPVSGCFAEETVTVFVNTKLVVVNTFTPNSDGINDAWLIEGLDADEYRNCEVTIYNRWGDSIFYSVGYRTPFTGIINGERLPATTYFYVIKPNLKVPVVSGYLTIIR